MTKVEEYSHKHRAKVVLRVNEMYANKFIEVLKVDYVYDTNRGLYVAFIAYRNFDMSA